MILFDVQGETIWLLYRVNEIKKKFGGGGDTTHVQLYIYFTSCIGIFYHIEKYAINAMVPLLYV